MLSRQFYRPLQSIGCVSRADYFDASLIDDDALRAAGMAPRDIIRFRMAISETPPEDLEEFLCKAGLPTLVPHCHDAGVYALDSLLDSDVMGPLLSANSATLPGGTLHVSADEVGDVVMLAPICHHKIDLSQREGINEPLN